MVGDRSVAELAPVFAGVHGIEVVDQKCLLFLIRGRLVR